MVNDNIDLIFVWVLKMLNYHGDENVILETSYLVQGHIYNINIINNL